MLQIEELVNVGTSLENRSSDANCALKLFLTDGRRRLVGFEVARIAGLGWRTPPGTKVAEQRMPRQSSDACAGAGSEGAAAQRAAAALAR